MSNGERPAGAWRGWTAADDQEITEQRGLLTTKEIAARVGRTPAAVAKRWAVLEKQAREAETEERRDIEQREAYVQLTAADFDDLPPILLQPVETRMVEFDAVAVLVRLTDSERQRVLEWAARKWGSDGKEVSDGDN